MSADIDALIAGMQDEPQTSRTALADCLGSLGSYVFALAKGDGTAAAEFAFEADLACADAFPFGSGESERLGFILAEVRSLAGVEVTL